MCRKNNIAEEQYNKLGPSRGVCDIHLRGWKREDGIANKINLADNTIITF